MSSIPPPVQGPQYSMRSAPSNYPPPQPKSYKWVAWMIGGILLVCGVCGFGGLQFMTHTGVIVDGKEVSRMQVFEAQREMHDVDREFKKTGYKSLDGTTKTTNPLTLRYRKYIHAILEQERLQREHYASYHADQVSRLMVSDQVGRDQARRQFAQHDARVNAYYDAELEIERQVQTLCVQVYGRDSEPVIRAMKKLQTGKSDYLAMKKARENLLSFMDKTPHQNSATGQALFESQGDLKAFDLLRRDWNGKSKLYTEHLKASQPK